MPLWGGLPMILKQHRLTTPGDLSAASRKARRLHSLDALRGVLILRPVRCQGGLTMARPIDLDAAKIADRLGDQMAKLKICAFACRGVENEAEGAGGHRGHDLRCGAGASVNR